ncbi:MAG: MBL fold metallo-hydrolase [Prolixibacteraceae bacterium]|nr:MBL fold metallo-hydrolase [Prolixibacteraceae bacterium]MBN2650498.1 MBL fold metallo-hydrolase [Prolixibacteraceae bacterium]
MKITFLGTGTSQGVPVVACQCPVCQSTDKHDKRLRSSVLIETEKATLVIDAGPDFRQQMLMANVRKLDAILLTHEHYDHIAGLDDIRAFNWVQQRATDIYAERRVHQSIKRIFSYVFASKKYPGIPQMNLYEIKNKTFEVNQLPIIPIRGMHYKLPVFGFRIGPFAYLTDFLTIEPAEIEKLKGIDTLVVNALRKEEHLSHMNLEKALKLIENVSPRQAYLTHVSHQMGLYREVSKLLPANVELAYDGLSLEFDL